MRYDKRIREALVKLETCGDDAQAAKLALELRKLLHEQVEQIRRTVLHLKKVRTGTTVWTVSLRRSDAGVATERCEPHKLP